jgi:hypothetical protein
VVLCQQLENVHSIDFFHWELLWGPILWLKNSN